MLTWSTRRKQVSDKPKTSQERGRLRNRRGRNKNERTKDISANKQAKQSDSIDPSISANDTGVVPEQFPQHTGITEQKDRPVQQSDPNLIEAQTEDLPAIEKESSENNSPKTDNRRRLRRHRGNKNRDQSTRDKSSAENQDLVLEQASDGTTRLENDSVSALSDAEKTLSSNVAKIDDTSEHSSVNDNLAVVATKRHPVKKTTTETPAGDHTATVSIDKPITTVAAPQSSESNLVKEFPDFKKSGLVMIETPPEKVETATEDIIIPKRPRRKTKEVVATESEPLMQVETRE